MFFGLRIAHICAYLFLPCSFLTMLQNLYYIFYKEKRIRKGNVIAVGKAVLYALIVTLVMVFGSMYSPGRILYRAPLLVAYLYGLLLLRPVNLMQLHLVTAQPLNLWRRGSILTLVILVLVTLHGESWGVGQTGIIWIYASLVLFNFVMCFHLLYYQCYELSEILDIDVFSIKRQIERHEKEIKAK